MNKKYIVRLSDEERALCQEVIKKLKGSSQKVRRAQNFLKADGPSPLDCWEFAPMPALCWTIVEQVRDFLCRVFVSCNTLFRIRFFLEDQ